MAKKDKERPAPPASQSPAAAPVAPAPAPAVSEQPAPKAPPALAPPDAIVPGTELKAAAEDLSDLPRVLQGALRAFNLKRRHLLGHRIDGDGVVIVTTGGRKLRFPGDEAKALALTEDEKDGVQKTPRFFPEGHLDGGKPRA
jgi:hypothetical protein